MPSTAAVLRVGGVQPFTTLDYPGSLAAVVFVAGCPWRCPYCHNAGLRSRSATGLRGWPNVREWLSRRAGLLDAVVFSGGEPTLDPALPAALREARALGYRVGLHSAGVSPRRLSAVLPLVDWIGLDVKAPLADAAGYARVTGVPGSAAAAGECVRAVLDAGVAYEFRTTAHPDLLDGAGLCMLAGDLHRRGARCFALQIARPEGVADAALGPVAPDYPGEGALARLRALFPRFTLRRD